jgi:predicted NAD/FAD-dependent oxidoreductase
VEADAVILAVPPPALAELLPEALRAEKPFQRAARLRPSPIVSVHLWLAATVSTRRMLGFLEGPIQWLFTPPMQPVRGRYVTLVASGAHELVELPPEEILAEARRTLARYLPEVAEVPWTDSLVAKERAATFAASPAEQRDRPGAATPVPNLFLAGDWTDTGLPATLESAVESGERAAARVLAALPGPP